MAQKRRIYYARTYRHLVQSTIKNILFFLLLILPAIILYFWNLHRLTAFICRVGVRILGKIFPGVPMNIFTVGYPVFGQVDCIELPTVYPQFTYIVGSLCVIFVVMMFLITGKRKGHPIAIYLLLSLLTHVVSCVFFLFATNYFPYSLADFSELYISQQISIWLIFIILSGLVTGFVGNKGYLYKCLTFLAMMAYSLVFGGVRYIVFLFVLYRFSVLYMAAMFFVFGPLFDFLYLVCIYSFFINKMTKYYDSGRGREEWRWS